MKKGISAISGVTSPTVGEKYTYHISEWYPNTPISEREQAKVTWELFKKRSDGRFTTTHIKKKGDSSFTFGESSAGETYRLEGYLYQPEGGGLIITPKASKIPKICKVDLNYVDDSKGSVFSFTEKLRAKAHCINMFNKEVLFTLWEDDAKGSGHNTTNQLIDTKKAKVDLYGDAEVDFMLTKALMKKAMEGETDIRELEFYVTVEYYKTKKHTTSNVEIKNPSPTENKKPSQPTAIKKAKGSPAEHKPRSKKEEKGVFGSISETIDEIWDWAETQGIAQRDKPHTIEIPEGKSPAVIGKTKVEYPKNNTKTHCICKQYDLIWGNKVSCDFRKKVVQICAELWGESKKIEMANGLMAVMNVETGGSFKAHQIMGKPIKDVDKLTKNDFWLEKKDGSKSSRAVGLIQFTQSALEALGEFKKGTGFDKLHEVKLKFAKMGEIKQLDYVEKYFQLDGANKNIKSPEDIYLHVFAPKGVGKSDGYVLYDSKSNDDNEKEFYRQNSSVDRENNNDGKIQRSEILGRYNSSLTQGKGNKENSFTCKIETPKKVDPVKDIITYKIYSNGKIEKNIPKEIKKGYEKKYKYQYIDKNEETHELGIYDIIKIQKFGGKKGVFINLIDLDKVQKKYSKGEYGYTFNVDSPRKYVNEKTLASFFGALLEVNYNDISCNGFSHADGSSKPSKSHINGNNGDFKYLRKDKKLMFGEGTSLDISKTPKLLDFERQNKWNEALYKFGWKSMLGWTYTLDGKTYKLRYIPKNSDNHHHHLHLQGYNPNFIEIEL
ncbi:hypothetical protein [Flavobacterium columnare]|nr:hypothetical protein [Flavobacterium columnare]